MTNLYAWLNILIVDDSSSLANYCQELLLDNYRIKHIQIANNGHQCLDKLKTNKNINMILLDLNMPDMDGVQLISKLAEVKYRGYIIIMSGVSSQIIKGVEQIIQKYQLNFLGSLQKPLCVEAIEVIFNRLSKSKFKNTQRKEPLKIYELIRAINNNSIIVHYQPQVNITTKAIVGVEALCRLMHPTRGIIYPDLFIEKAEDSELIYHLTINVLRTALSDLKQWLADGINLVMNINISPAIFNYKNFFPDLINMCKEFAIPHHLVCLEITEGILAKDEISELETISRLAMHGFILSLDDFGTGHASIERFFNLPFQQIKIDKSVFSSHNIDETNTNIIATTAAMAKRSNLEVVIEGIESFDNWTMAKHHGCDVGQGYYISRPVSAKELLVWREHWLVHACS